MSESCHLGDHVFSDHIADVDIQRHFQLMQNRQRKHHFQSVTSLLLFKSRVKSILSARYLSFPATLFNIRASNSNLRHFHSFSHDFEENKELDQVITTNASSFFCSFPRSYFIKATDHSFCGFTGAINHLGCWDNTRKACKSRAVRPLRRVIYKLFSCSPNIPSGLLRW